MLNVHLLSVGWGDEGREKSVDSTTERDGGNGLRTHLAMVVAPWASTFVNSYEPLGSWLVVHIDPSLMTMSASLSPWSG